MMIKKKRFETSSFFYLLLVSFMTYSLSADTAQKISLPKLINQTSNRSVYLMNGLYYFSPSEKKPDLSYSKDMLIRVPGLWNGFVKSGDQVIDSKGNIIKSLPGLKRENWNYGLYSLPIRVPEKWKGRYLVLEIGDLEYEGEVFVNGKAIGKQCGWMRKYFDLTGMLKAGEEALLQILVKGFEHKKRPYGEKDEKKNSGIISDVKITALEHPVYSEFIDLQTRIADKQAIFTLELSNIGDHKINGSLTVSLSRNGQQKASSSINLEIPTGKSRHKITIPLDKIKLWYPDDPQLYDITADIEVDGKKIDSSPLQKTGFREVSLQGCEFRINNVKTTLFCESAGRIAMTMNQCGSLKFIEKYLNAYRTMGYNTVNLDDLRAFGQTLDCTDETGMMALLRLPETTNFAALYMDRTCAYFEKEIPAEAFDKFLKKSKSFIERFALHPSVIMCYSTMNFTCYSDDAYNSHKLGTKHDCGTVMKERSAFADRVERAMSKLDPARIHFNWHSTSSGGQIYTHNRYVSFGFPLQENCDFLKLWNDNKSANKLPFIVTESFLGKFYGIHNKWGQSSRNKKWKGLRGPFMIAEYESIYTGPSAYFSHEAAKKKRRSQATTELFAEREIPAFRYYNITGFFTHTDSYEGFIPVDEPRRKAEGVKLSDNVPGFVSDTQIWKGPSDKITGTGKALNSVFSPLNMFIMGPEDNPTSVEHIFYGGTEINKSIFAVNETSRMRDLKVDINLEDGSKKYPVATLDLKLEPGARALKKIKVKLPKVEATKAMKLKAVMTENGNVVKSETFEIKVFPEFNKRIINGNEIAYYDVGGTLEKIFSVYKLKDSKDIEGLDSLDGIKLIVVGRKSLDKKFEKLVKKLNIPNWVRNGGKALILEQKGKKLLGLNLDRRRMRYVFKAFENHPYTEGLEDSDLNNWQGKGELTEEFQEAGPGYSFSELLNTTNTGIVSAFLMEKPHLGNFSAPIEGGYDMQFSPLMLFNDGKGRVILSQLDLSHRIGTDPAATLLLYNIIKCALSETKRQDEKWAWIGGAATEKFIKEFNVRAENLAHPQDLSSLTGIILGKGCGKVVSRKDMSEFLSKGGKVVCLWSMDDKGLLPAPPKNLDIKTDKVYKTLQDAKKRTLPISVSDTSWHDKFKFSGWGFKDKNINSLVDEIKIDKGSIVFCRINPEAFKRHYFSMKPVRLWNMILNSQGVPRTSSFSERLLDFCRNSNIPLGNAALFRTDPENKGKKEGWMNFELNNKEGWKKIVVPGVFEKVPYLEAFGVPNPPPAAPGYNGFAWYRFEVMVPEEMKGSPAILSMGVIDDHDWTYFNGKLVGHIGTEFGANAYSAERKYRIPSDIIRYGKKNVIVVRVNDIQGNGGIARGPLALKFISDKPGISSLYLPDESIMEVFGVSPYYNEQW